LIVDEVLAVGDAEFQKKCLGKMNDVSKGEGRTVLFVSHNLAAVKSLCNNGIFLSNGQISLINSIDLVVNTYLESNEKEKIKLNTKELSLLYNSDIIEITNVELLSDNNFSINELTIFKVNFKIFGNLKKFNLSLVLYDINEVAIFNTISDVKEVQDGSYEANLKIPQDFLNDSFYSIRLLFVNNSKALVDLPNLISWSAVETKERGVNWFGKFTGVIRPNLEWNLNEMYEEKC
jgi:lipopolysaccharide transport system ATP-binding protein